MVRGRVLDAETGQALPFIKVYLYEAGEQAGEALLTRLDGRFEAPRQGKRLRLRFRDGLTGAYLGNVPVPSSSDEVVFEAEVGPTLIVRLSGAPQERMDWFVRLVGPGKSPYSTDWSRQDGAPILFPEFPESYGLEPPSRAFPDRAQSGAWRWLSPKFLEPDGVLVARYGLQEELARAPGSALAIQVIEQKEVWQGERRIESALGVISSEIAVEPKCVLLSGRVVDENGNAVGAEVVAFPRGPRDSSSPPARVASTGLEGAWTMKDLPPGPARVLVFSANRPVERVDVELALGAQEPLDIVLPRAPLAADVNGALVSPARGEDPEGIVCLEPTAGAAWAPRPWVQAKLSTAGRALFSFEDVPPGGHRLNVIALDGRSYTPSPEPTAEGGYAEFTTQQPDNPRPWKRYDLRLRDAVTKADLQSGSFLLCIAPYWCSKLIHGDPLQALVRLGEDAPVLLLVSHPGHVPAVLQLPAALRSAQDKNDQVDVEFDLEKGHGAGLIVLDAEHAPRSCLAFPTRGDWAHVSRWNWSRLDEFLPMRGLPGAKVVSDGKVVGTSDELGLALCVSDKPIRRFAVELEGWTMVDVQGFRGDEEVSPCLGYVVMVRE